MQPYTFAGDCHMSQALQMFIEERGIEIMEKNLYRHFVLHVSSLFEFGIIDPGQVLDAISQMQEFILEQNHWSEKIEKNPETPVAKLEKDRKAPRKIIPVKESNSKTYIATVHDLDGSFCIPIEEIESESIEMKIETESKKTRIEPESKKTKIEPESMESKPVSAIGRAIQRLKAKKTPQPEAIDTKIEAESKRIKIKLESKESKNKPDFEPILISKKDAEFASNATMFHFSLSGLAEKTRIELESKKPKNKPESRKPQTEQESGKKTKIVLESEKTRIEPESKKNKNEPESEKTRIKLESKEIKIASEYWSSQIEKESVETIGPGSEGTNWMVRFEPEVMEIDSSPNSIIKNSQNQSEFIIENSQNQSESNVNHSLRSQSEFTIKNSQNQSESKIKHYHKSQSKSLIKNSQNHSEFMIKNSQNQSESMVKNSQNQLESMIKNSQNQSESVIKNSQNQSESMIKNSHNQSESIIKNSQENQYDSKINNLRKPQSEKSNLKNSFQTTKKAAPSTKKIIAYKCKVCDYETSWTSRRPTTDIRIHMVRTHEVDELKTNWNRYFQLSKVERFVVLPYNQTLSMAEKKSNSTAVPRDSASKLITEKFNPFVFMSSLNSETLKQKNGQ